MIVVLNDAMTIFLTFFAASKWMHKVNTCSDINRTTFWSRTIYFVNASVNVSAERVHLKARQHETTWRLQCIYIFLVNASQLPFSVRARTSLRIIL